MQKTCVEGTEQNNQQQLKPKYAKVIFLCVTEKN